MGVGPEWTCINPHTTNDYITTYRFHATEPSEFVHSYACFEPSEIHVFVQNVSLFSKSQGINSITILPTAVQTDPI